MDAVEVRELLARARDGDASAWTRLFEEFTPVLVRAVERYGAAFDDAEDVVSDAWSTFVELVADPAEIVKSPFRLLLVTARNRWLDRLRSSENARRVPGDARSDEFDEGKAPATSPGSLMRRREVARSIVEIAATLSDVEREVLRLVDANGMTPREVADLTRRSLDAVRKALYRARRLVRERLRRRWGGR